MSYLMRLTDKNKNDNMKNNLSGTLRINKNLIHMHSMIDLEFQKFK